jgi:hypothetical protein
VSTKVPSRARAALRTLSADVLVATSGPELSHPARRTRHSRRFCVSKPTVASSIAHATSAASAPTMRVCTRSSRPLHGPLGGSRLPTRASPRADVRAQRSPSPLASSSTRQLELGVGIGRASAAALKATGPSTSFRSSIDAEYASSSTTARASPSSSTRMGVP